MPSHVVRDTCASENSTAVRVKEHRTKLVAAENRAPPKVHSTNEVSGELHTSQVCVVECASFEHSIGHGAEPACFGSSEIAIDDPRSERHTRERRTPETAPFESAIETGLSGQCHEIETAVE